MCELERESKKSIIVRINSPGGDVYESLAMVGRMRSSKCQVITEGYGQMMSAAGFLLAAGNKRYMSKYAMFMWHESSYRAGGRHSTVKEYVNQLEVEERLFAKWMAEFTNQTAEFWYEKGRVKDYYLTADECLEFGIIDGII